MVHVKYTMRSNHNWIIRPGGGVINTYLCYVCNLVHFIKIASSSLIELNHCKGLILCLNCKEHVCACYVPQSSAVDKVSHENNPLDAGVDKDTSRTTVFVENTRVARASFTGKSCYDEIETRYESIVDFLAKPMRIATGLWDTTTAANVSLFSRDLDELVIATAPAHVDIWTDKIKGFKLVRGNFHIRVELTANRFQNGALVMHYIPCAAEIGPNTALMHNATLNGVLQQPNVIIDAADSSAEMVIPYITPATHWDVELTSYSWGIFWLRVLYPLKTGAAGETTVRYNVYAWISDAELAAPMYPQMNTEDSPGPISKGLRAINTLSRTLKSVPLLSDVAQPMEWVTRYTSNLASALGWSKPTNNNQTAIMSRSNWRYNGTAEGADNSFPLGLSADNCLDVRQYSIRPEDEMSARFLMSVPNYMGSFTWNVTDSIGTSVFSQRINPSVLGIVGTVTHVATTATYIQGAPFVYLSNLFTYWRGSFKIKVRLIKTEMHKGKLQVTWTPSAKSGVPPSIDTSVYAARHIIDIAQKDTFELELPYWQPYTWMYVDASRSGSPYSDYSGVVSIQVLNELRAPETCSGSVGVLIWIEPGDDFEYAGPGSVHDVNRIPFVPQMSASDMVCQASVLDSTSTLENAGIGGALHRVEDINHAKQTVGEKFSSVKQLLSRMSQCILGNSLLPSTNQLVVWPYFSQECTLNSSGNYITPYFYGDVLGYMMPCYAFMRGGIRLGVSVMTSDPKNLQMALVPASYMDSNAIVASFTKNNLKTGIQLPQGNGNFVGVSQTESDYAQGLVSVRVPFYNRTPVTCCRSQILAPYIGPDTPVNCVLFSNVSYTDEFKDSVIYRSACDDFAFSFFIGCPPLFVGTS